MPNSSFPHVTHSPLSLFPRLSVPLPPPLPRSSDPTLSSSLGEQGILHRPNFLSSHPVLFCRHKLTWPDKAGSYSFVYWMVSRHHYSLSRKRLLHCRHERRTHVFFAPLENKYVDKLNDNNQWKTITVCTCRFLVMRIEILRLRHSGLKGHSEYFGLSFSHIIISINRAFIAQVCL